MTTEEIEKFRHDFRVIVYAKQRVKDCDDYLRKLHAFDKDGSHNNAILKALDRRNELKDHYIDLLKGATYEMWLTASKKISAMKSQLKGARRPISKMIAERKIANYQLPF